MPCFSKCSYIYKKDFLNTKKYEGNHSTDFTFFHWNCIRNHSLVLRTENLLRIKYENDGLRIIFLYVQSFWLLNNVKKLRGRLWPLCVWWTTTFFFFFVDQNENWKQNTNERQEKESEKKTAEYWIHHS